MALYGIFVKIFHLIMVFYGILMKPGCRIDEVFVDGGSFFRVALV